VISATGRLPASKAESAVLTTAEATGRILRQIVRAERSQPPFDRVMMDGIAIAWSDYDNGQRSFPIQAMQAAGDAVLSLESGQCIEIMTGASLPLNANCIVPVERISVADNSAAIDADYEVKKDRFVHPHGSDFAKGAHLLTPGKRISPMDIAIIASCGETEVDGTARRSCRCLRTTATGGQSTTISPTTSTHCASAWLHISRRRTLSF